MIHISVVFLTSKVLVKTAHLIHTTISEDKQNVYCELHPFCGMGGLLQRRDKTETCVQRPRAFPSTREQPPWLGCDWAGHGSQSGQEDPLPGCPEEDRIGFHGLCHVSADAGQGVGVAEVSLQTFENFYSHSVF